MKNVLLQENLFQNIREKLPTGSSLADAVAEVLHLSSDSAYRRIRGETPLVLEEIQTLCRHFAISADALMDLDTEVVRFTPVRLNNTGYDFGSYLAGILKSMQQVKASKGEIIYMAKDLPIFHHFLYRPLFAFRYFFWMKSILQHPDFQNVKFKMNCLPGKIESLGDSILEAYGAITSTEIWNTECINSTIAQVEYYREAGYFTDANDISLIYDALRSTIEHIRAQAEAGYKFMPGESGSKENYPFKFFYNRVVLGDNTIMAIHQGRKTLFLNYDVLNYMATEDERFCEEVYQKMQTLMKRATIISAVSEKQRNIFFNILTRKIPNR